MFWRGGGGRRRRKEVRDDSGLNKYLLPVVCQQQSTDIPNLKTSLIQKCCHYPLELKERESYIIP